MKHVQPLLFIFILLSSLLSHSQVNSLIPLDASWRFRATDTLDWMPAQVPGCVHTDLERERIIENPLLGINEKNCQWIENKSWIYETLPFDISNDLLEKQVLRMQFSQLDTYAHIYLNDSLLMVTENTFRSYEADVKPFVKSTSNILRIEFSSPLTVGKEKLSNLGYPLPGDPMRAVTRKPQYHYGWDWGPRLVTSGITGPIHWIAYNDFNVKDVFFEQVFISTERVELHLQLELHSVSEHNYSISIEDPLNGIFKKENLTLRKGPNDHSVELTIRDPKLWWCNGLGEPYQYNFEVTILDGSNLLYQHKFDIGLRNIELITDQDQYGESFYFKLNGVPVFSKGANYIPISMLPGTSGEEQYNQLLTLCADHHFNMLRVWGGGYYEQEEFYAICDRLGILIWQDFMFACSMYPGNPAFLNNVSIEAEYQTKRLRNHACMALWCGNNENAEGWERWGWQQGLSALEKEKLQVAYDTLFEEILPSIVHANHPQLNYWPSSPRFGRGDARSLTEGDSHYWGLWHDEEPFEILLQKVPRFMSEFGMQSFPNKETFLEITTTDNFSWDDPGLLQHQKHSRGNKLMRQYMERWLDINGTLRDYSSDPFHYLALTQSVQAEGMMMGIEAQRRAAPYCMGTLFWQLNDVWPAFSWSAVDYKMQPKLLMSCLREAYAPELISPIVEDGFLHIYYLNDTRTPGPIVHLHYQLRDENNTVIFSKQQEFISLKESGVKYSERWSDIMGDRGLENLLLDVSFIDLKGEIYLQRTVKLQAKSSAGFRYIADKYGEVYITNISD